MSRERIILQGKFTPAKQFGEPLRFFRQDCHDKLGDDESLAQTRPFNRSPNRDFCLPNSQRSDDAERSRCDLKHRRNNP
jgi:hypothetical protein